MPEYLAPGVHVEEQPKGPSPIGGVPTDAVGFVGQAARGPTTPREVVSWEDFLDLYGDPIEHSFLGPAIEGFFANGGRRCYVARVCPADGSTATPADYIGDRGLPVEESTGLAALEAIDEVSILTVPDEVLPGDVDLSPITGEMIAQCERRGDRFAILSTADRQDDVHALRPRPVSSYAAIYYPWIRVPDLATGTSRLIPPAGHVAGLIAHTDTTRGVHAAPANVALRGVVDLEFPVTDRMQEVLNPLGVNCLRDFRASGRGVVLFGARTLSSDPEWRYVPVRRFFLHVETSLDRGTRWVAFEPNDAGLWARVREQVESFLAGLWRQGALLGTKPEDAFFVRCDRTTMTQDDIDSGRLVCLIGIAPTTPGEFVIFRIGQKTADASA